MVDAVAQGFLLAAAMTAVSAALGMYWVGGQGHEEDRGDGSFGELFILLYLSIIALTITSFTIAACFDNTQAASMFAFFFLVGSVVIFFVLALTAPEAFNTSTEQTLWCLIPSLALQIGLMTKFNVMTETGQGIFGFTKSGDTIEFGTILGMLVVDMLLYALLAWYLGQVVPSKFGVTKNFLFPLQPSFWSRCCSARDQARDQEGQGAATSTPEESESSARLGLEEENDSGGAVRPGGQQPTLVVDGLRKTFESFVAVDNLSFKVHEGQCFALLGSNGNNVVVCCFYVSYVWLCGGDL